jgi:hypothetical protein
MASGLLDAAVGIGDLAHSLTDSVMQAIGARMSERGRSAPGAAVDDDFLRRAIFHGIAQNIIARVEMKLRDNPVKPGV